MTETRRGFFQKAIAAAAVLVGAKVVNSSRERDALGGYVVHDLAALRRKAGLEHAMRIEKAFLFGEKECKGHPERVFMLDPEKSPLTLMHQMVSHQRVANRYKWLE